MQSERAVSVESQATASQTNKQKTKIGKKFKSKTFQNYPVHQLDEPNVLVNDVGCQKSNRCHHPTPTREKKNNATDDGIRCGYHAKSLLSRSLASELSHRVCMHACIMAVAHERVAFIPKQTPKNTHTQHTQTNSPNNLMPRPCAWFYNVRQRIQW